MLLQLHGLDIQAHVRDGGGYAQFAVITARQVVEFIFQSVDIGSVLSYKVALSPSSRAQSNAYSIS